MRTLFEASIPKMRRRVLRKKCVEESYAKNASRNDFFFFAVICYARQVLDVMTEKE
jgi:hypothetical protein